MSGRGIRRELRRMRAYIGTPEDRAASEAWERAQEALCTLEDLLRTRADEIDHEYEKRVGLGKDHKAALVGAKRTVWERSEEGRAALAVVEPIENKRGGRG